MTRRRIEVEIDGLAVEGRAPARRDLVARAIRQELAQMTSPGGPLSSTSGVALEGLVEGAVSRALGGDAVPRGGRGGPGASQAGSGGQR